MPTLSPEMSFSDIIVPTMDFVRGAYLIEKLLRNKKKVKLNALLEYIFAMFLHYWLTYFHMSQIMQ